MAFACPPVIGEIAQVDEYCQHVVLALDDRHVVLELSGIHRHPLSRKHADDIILQIVTVNFSL